MSQEGERRSWYPGQLINTILDRWLKPTNRVRPTQPIAKQSGEVPVGAPSPSPDCPTCGDPRKAVVFMRTEQGLPEATIERLFGVQELHRQGIISDGELERRMTAILQGVEEDKR